MKINASDILLSILALLAVIVTTNDVSVVRSKGNGDLYPYPNPSLIVANANDSGTGSLRQAISDAVSGDTITFDPSLSGQIIRLSSTLSIEKDLIIDGSALNQNVKINGDTNRDQFGDVRIFSVAQNVTGELRNIDIEYGNYSGGSVIGGGGILNKGNLIISACIIDNNRANYGGGIYNYLNATLTISNSILSNNVGFSGGGITNIGTLQITNSTFVNNSIDNNGSGSAIQAGGKSTIRNSTFNNNSGGNGALYHMSNNSADYFFSENNTFRSNSPYAIFNRNGNGVINNNTIYANKGGIYIFSDRLDVSNTIVSHNSWNGNPSDCVKYVGASGTTGVGLDDHNFFSSDTNCGVYVSGYGISIENSLADNGGPTQTLALMSDSPAIDAGNNDTCPANDQRGVARPQGTYCDIGAFEYILFSENDDFDSAKDIASLSYVDEISTSYATIAGDDPIVGACGFIGKGTATVWYKYNSDANEAISIDTLNTDYDTFIAVWTGTRGEGNLSLVTCNNDFGGTQQSSVAFQVISGTVYYIEIGQP